MRVGRLLGSGRSGSGGFKAVVPNALHSAADVERGTVATYRNIAGELETAAIDTARLHSSEVLGRNEIRNPRGENDRQHWGFPAGAAGVAITHVGSGTDPATGLPFVDHRFLGTTSTSGAWRGAFETGSFVAAAIGQTWTHSAYVQLVSGSLPAGTAFSIEVREFNGGTGLLQSGSNHTPGGAAQRVFHTRTLDQATVNNVQPTFRIGYPAGAEFDLVLRFMAPQIEQGANPSEVSLPPVGEIGPSELRNPGRLLVEEARANLIRNSAATGAVAGTPGTLPTNWAATSHANLSTTVVATSTDRGLSYVRLRFATTGDVPANIVSIVPETSVASTGSTAYALAWSIRAVAGTAPTLRFGWQDGVTTDNAVAVSPAALSPHWTRHAGAKISSIGAATGRCNLVWALTPGQVYDWTVDVALPQLEAGTAATSPIPTTGATAARAADDIAFELGPWFRNGETVTNTFTHSADANAAWGLKSAITVTSNATTAPDGTMDADTLVETASNTGHYVERTLPISVPGKLVTFSCYLKSAGRNTAWLQMFSNDFADTIRCSVSALDGTPTVGGFNNSGGASGATGTITSFGNGWHRATLTGIVTQQSTAIKPRISLINGSTTYAGDGASGVYVWGAMVHDGQPIAHLATTAATASRQLCGPGTLVVQARLPNGVLPLLPLFGLNDGSTANDHNSLTLRVNSGGNGLLAVAKVNNVQTASGAVAPLAPTVSTKLAVAWDRDGYSVSVDGQGVSTVATPGGPMFALTKMAIGRLILAGTGYANAEIARVEYRPRRLADAALTALTAP